MPSTIQAKDPCRAISIASKGKLTTGQVRVLKALSTRKKPLTRFGLEQSIRVDMDLPPIELKKDGSPIAPKVKSAWRPVGRWSDELWALRDKGYVFIAMANEGERELRHEITDKGRSILKTSTEASKS